jgi:hypothetical protein
MSRVDITVGLSVSLSGRFRLLRAALQGFLLWQSYINAQGGIAVQNGEKKPVRLWRLRDQKELLWSDESMSRPEITIGLILSAMWANVDAMIMGLVITGPYAFAFPLHARHPQDLSGPLGLGAFFGRLAIAALLYLLKPREKNSGPVGGF